ncbi:MAG: hypothetical protein AB2598_13810 [Candidatus Thiodiazotropha sp.]
MQIKYPDFVPAIEMQEQPLNYQWDDWDPYVVLGRNNENVEEFLSTVTHNCKLIYSLGCAEWVLARYKVHEKSEEARMYLDSCWAYSISDEFSLPEELDDEMWEGKVFGPICLSLTTVINTLYGIDEDNAEIDSAFAEKVVLHILPETSKFLQWRKIIFERMEKHFLIQSGDLMGSVLPRDFLNPSIQFEKTKLKEMINSTYKEIKTEGNRYLHKADDEY